MAKASKYKYYTGATVKDELDGSIYTLGSTNETMTIEISGNTHPFYTGQETLIDTAGRIDKFKSRQAAANGATKNDKTRAKKGKSKQSLAEMMKQDEAESKATPIKKVKKIVAQETTDNILQETPATELVVDAKAE